MTIQSAPPIQNRHLVRELDRGRIREMLLVVGLVALVLLPLLAYVWNHMEWIRIGYDLERLRKERAAQVELRERLRIEKAALESLARVEREAVTTLGLVPADGAVVFVPDPPERAPEVLAKRAETMEKARDAAAEVAR